MNLIKAVRTRHSVKAYEPGRSLPQDVVDELFAVLHMSPSSVNSQPWHFVVASTPEGRERLTKAATGPYAYNEPKIRNASHVVVMAARREIGDDHLSRVLAQEEGDGRFVLPGGKEAQQKSRLLFVDLHRYERNDALVWMTHQVYLALGGFLLAAATLGVDATPMEGFDSEVLDAELGLDGQGYTSIVLVALGYRSEQDFNAKLPKSRLPIGSVFTHV